MSFFFLSSELKLLVGSVVMATNDDSIVYCLDVLFLLFLQVPECHPDNVPTHPAIPYNCSHHQQRRTKAQASAQGLGESHSTGTVDQY